MEAAREIRKRIFAHYITTVAGTIVILLDLLYLGAEILRLVADSEHQLDIDWILFVSLLLLGLILIGAKDQVIKQIKGTINVKK